MLGCPPADPETAEKSGRRRFSMVEYALLIAGCAALIDIVAL